ncbi:baseplate J/gp47 family protein [Azospirillum argentinense]
MTTYPLPTLAATVSASGITAPPYADIYASLQASFQAIYGSDSYIAPDSQDGQLLAIFARAIHDSNSATIAAYNNFSPATAQGVGLSYAVKINGIAREAATYSAAAVTLTGQAGAVIAGGIVGDNQSRGTQWLLPASVTIPPEGEVTVGATCTTVGAVSAEAGTLTVILTPQRGWQSVTNAAPASIGRPVESDAALRQRQARSTSLAAETPLEAIFGTVANVTGVTRTALYQNDTSMTDGNGIPGHSICVVVEGGAPDDIAAAIAAKKSPGTGTHGGTSVTVTDASGVPVTIRYDVLDYTQVYATVTITALPGYSSVTGGYVVAALVQEIGGTAIGGTVFFGRLWAAANLSGTAALAAVSAATGSSVTQAQLDALSATYEVTAITVGTAPDPVGAANVPVAFNAVAQTAADQITLTVE